MKKLILGICGLLFTQVIFSQSQINITILDKNANGVKQDDVQNIMVKICSGDTVTSIYSEVFTKPTIEGGIANLDLGKSYSDSLKKYLKGFPVEKRPKAGSFLVIKVIVTLKNGTTINIIDDIKLSTPEPVVKTDGDNTAMLSPTELLLMKVGNDAVAQISSESLTINADDNKAMLSPTELLLMKVGKEAAAQVSSESLSIYDDDDEAILTPNNFFLSNHVNKTFLDLKSNSFSLGDISKEKGLDFSFGSGLEINFMDTKSKIDYESLTFNKAPNQSASYGITGLIFGNPKGSFSAAVGDNPAVTLENIPAKQSSVLTPNSLKLIEDGAPRSVFLFDNWNMNAKTGEKLVLDKTGIQYNTQLIDLKLGLPGLFIQTGNSIFTAGSGNLSINNTSTKLSTTLNNTSISFLNNNIAINTITSNGFQLGPIDGNVIKLDKNEFSMFDAGKNTTSKFSGHGLEFENAVNKMIFDVISGRLFNEDKVKKQRTDISTNSINLFNKDIQAMHIGINPLGEPDISINGVNGLPLFSINLNENKVIDLKNYNPGGKAISGFTTLAGTNGNAPLNYVANNGGPAIAGFYVDPLGRGVMFAGIKNFRMDHPDMPDKDIVYASLEGPEAAAYCRGTGHLEQGKAFVRFPEHFNYVCIPASRTYQLTPHSAKSKGLAVTKITDEGFTVEELSEGVGEYEFYWEVKGIRSGFENYQVVRPKSEIMAKESSQEPRNN